MSDVPTTDSSDDSNRNDSPNDKNVTSQKLSDPDPLANVKPSDVLLEAYQQQAHIVFGPYAQAHGMTLEEYYQALDKRAQGLLENAQPWMRVEDPTDLEAILQDGKFKSGFETGSLVGFHADFRIETESGLFSYHTDMDPADRPVYGYPTTDPNGRGYAAVDSYGGIAIRFNANVGSRATVTFSDTLTASNGINQLDMVATPFKNPDGRSFTTFVARGTVPDPLKASDADLMKYAELQYHGEVLVKDIAEVVFRDKSPQRVLDILQNLGIPYR